MFNFSRIIYKLMNDKRGCFGGGGKTQTPQSQPLPSPQPTPTPSDISPQQTVSDRARRLRDLQYGYASTIKTTARGITGGGADLKAPILTGKDKLG